MVTVITYGTFDLFHLGHLRLLERAKNLGSKLYVGVSTDSFNLLKTKSSVVPYTHRATIVKALKCVDDVFPEESWEQKESDIKRFNANILVMGNDWEGKFNHLSAFCKIVYLQRTLGISTSKIKSSITEYK